MSRRSAPADFYVPGAYGADESVGWLMRRVTQSIIQVADQRLAAHGLTSAQWTPLFKIHKQGGTATVAALMLSLAFASLVKSRLLSRILSEPVNNWRWPLVWAAAAAALVGWAATRFLPEWAELAFGVPAILAVYCAVIWSKGFGPEDRVLFRKAKA